LRATFAALPTPAAHSQRSPDASTREHPSLVAQDCA
jgi:hypothetical protein